MCPTLHSQVLLFSLKPSPSRPSTDKKHPHKHQQERRSGPASPKWSGPASPKWLATIWLVAFPHLRPATPTVLQTLWWFYALLGDIGHEVLGDCVASRLGPRDCHSEMFSRQKDNVKEFHQFHDSSVLFRIFRQTDSTVTEGSAVHGSSVVRLLIFLGPKLAQRDFMRFHYICSKNRAYTFIHFPHPNDYHLVNLMYKVVPPQL